MIANHAGRNGPTTQTGSQRQADSQPQSVQKTTAQFAPVTHAESNPSLEMKPSAVEAVSPTKSEEAQNETLDGRKHYKKMPTTASKYRFVWVDPRYKYDPDVYEQAVSEIGGNEAFCFILFWDNRGKIPAKMPMSDDQMQSQVAQYERNRTTGHERFFYLRNGDMVEPFGSRPATTPTPSKIPMPAPHDEPTREPMRSAESEFRTWADSSGRFKTEAKFGGVAFGKVKLTKKDGTAIQLPLEKLSDEDQQWIKDRKR